MYWYKITAGQEEDEPYYWVGSSNETMDGLAAKAARGEYIHLTNLLYQDRDAIKEWAEWDASQMPEIYLNPRYIYNMMQFKGDPRTTPNR